MSSCLTFTPLYQERIWGGRSLETQLNRELPLPDVPYGESWEMVDREEAQSVVNHGPLAGTSLHELWVNNRADVFGETLLSHPAARYPLLMKILDARDDLSIQVHPPAAKADELQGEPKTEMWFIAHAEPGAKIYAGVKEGVDRAVFEQAIATGTVPDVIHVLEPQTGDCLFIPSGRAHAIGAGLLIYEIQQNSDTTYRVFDWNRVGLDGKPRQLHVQESLASIDFDDSKPAFQSVSDDGLLVACEYFEVYLREADQKDTLEQLPAGTVIAVTRGSLTSAETPLAAGSFALIPAAAAPGDWTSSPDAQWLEIRIPL